MPVTKPKPKEPVKPSLLEELYAALVKTPCACRYTWEVGFYDASQADTLEGRKLAYQCPRCAVIERYQRETSHV